MNRAATTHHPVYQDTLAEAGTSQTITMDQHGRLHLFTRPSLRATVPPAAVHAPRARRAVMGIAAAALCLALVPAVGLMPSLPAEVSLVACEVLLFLAVGLYLAHARSVFPNEALRGDGWVDPEMSAPTVDTFREMPAARESVTRALIQLAQVAPQRDERLHGAALQRCELAAWEVEGEALSASV